MPSVLRLCLDLNIWCAALIADRKGRQGTASQSLVEIVRQGHCALGPVQLVISWGMLNRLRTVLERSLNVPHLAADLYIDAIRGYAQLGPTGASPQLTLGGVGVIALQDVEDAHVLETALAGRANVLVTANFRDFISNDTHVIVPERHAVHVAAAHVVYIVHPYLMMDWLRQGHIPIPELPS
jgi:predicted nucleic acid-binding protein